MSFRWIGLAAALFSIGQLAGCASVSKPAPPLVQTFSAVGDGKTKVTAALQAALDRCAAASGGGEVDVPAGNYLIGSVQIKSNTTLKLSENATLIGSPDPDDYPIIPVRYEGETVQGHRALICADHASQIAILGPGTLQGDEQIGDLRHPRAPVMIELTNCDHVRLADFKDRYRRMWSIHLLLCHDVLAQNLNIRTTRSNGDGIDVDSSEKVRIEKCDIDTGDDCISLKSGRGVEAAQLNKPTANIIIYDCTLGSDFAGIGIGTEISCGVHDVQISRCKFTRGSNAIFIKSRVGRGGVLENIAATDLDTSTKTCIGINLVNKGIEGTHPVTGEAAVTLLKNVSFNNVTIHTGTLVDGSNVLPDKPIEDLSLTNITGTCSKAISLANVTDCRLENIHVTGYSGPFLKTDNVTGTGLESAAAPAAYTADSDEIKQLAESFLQPPDNTRALVRWWWFGPAVTKPELGREIDAMKAGGFGGFEVQQTYPLAVDGQPAGLVNLKFLSPEYLDDLGFVAQKAKDTGMRMDLTLGSGWPYGGPMFPITEAAGRIRSESVRFTQGQTSVPFPRLRDGESIIAASAANTDLTIDGQSAKIPSTVSGAGEVLFFIASHTGMKVKRPATGAEGYVIDHESPTVVAKFIDEIGKKQLEACGANPPHAIFCDSLEVAGEDWTDNFLAEFQKRRGYDLRPLLPALVTDIGPKTLDIRHDWGQTLTELFNDAFMKPLRSLAADHKTLFRIQAYGSPAAAQFSYGDADLPEGEGWQWHGYRASRYASSACHLMGVPISSSETFTWIHNLVFRATPLDIKAEADVHFLQGINQLICHGWPYTAAGVPDPGWSFYAAGVFDEKNPWYIVAPDVNRYIARVSYMMRQGKPANDVLLYLANDDAWAHFTPGHISLTDGVGVEMGREIVPHILDAGYNLDFFDDQMLDQFGRVNDGNIAFGDVRYKVVVLAGVERMPLATLRKLDEFSRAGGVLIATRRQPTVVPGFNATDADQKEARDICQRLFNDKGAPGIFIKDESQFAAALATRLAPDVAFAPAAPQIGVVHRHTDSADIYFLANTSNQPVKTTATFRIEGARPQSWNPVTGERKDVESTSGAASIEVSLDAYESTIIVWTRGTASAISTAPAAAPQLPPAPVDLSTNWTVQFGKDAAAVRLPKLSSWTDNPATRNFSGVATYTNHFTVPAEMLADGSPKFLTFGPSRAESQRVTRAGNGFEADLAPPVREAAVVYINDKLAGSVWCSPYKLDVTHWLTPGDNSIRIDVANTMVNSIAAAGFPNYDLRAIMAQYGNRFTPNTADQFQPVSSGLMGPIILTTKP